MKTTIKSYKSLSRSARVGAAVLGLAGAAALAWAAPARADFGIASFDGTVSNQDGSPATQAGSHPFEATTTIDFATGSNGFPLEDAKDVQVDLPAGLIGNPNAVPECTREQFQDAAGFGGGCPPETQVGMTTLKTPLGDLPFPVYNLTPKPGEPARFAFRALIPPVYIDARVRTEGDYGLSVNISDVSAALPLAGTSLTFWGVPADPAHDADRGGPSTAPPKPFLTIPTSCNGPVTTTLHADSWQDPGDFKTASFVTHDNDGNPVGAGGCDVLRFDPTLSVQPQSSAADSPSGLSVDLHIPQTDSVNSLATAHLKKAVVRLPEGVSVNPGAADGLGACSPAQIGLGSAAAPTCPDSSQIGTAEIDTPLLNDPMRGSIYLAQQNSNPFGSLLAIYLVAESHGVLVKLPGKIDADRVSGRLTATFDNTPQLPFTDFKLNFDGGPRAALATPAACGTYTATSELTPYSAPDSGPPATPSGSFGIGSQCGGGFSPSMAAGSTDSSAGQGTAFTLQVARADGDQHLKSVSVSLPPGLLGNVGSVPLCGEVAAAFGMCDASSQVGTATVGAGPGSHQFYLQGKVYLTGPYKGAPFGLSIVVPALAGPLNLGTVVVRATVNVDPRDAHLTIASDDLPSILQGIPLRLRSIAVDVNRSGFMFNPTNCSVMGVAGQVASLEGAVANASSRFQVGGCSGLSFSPTVSTKLTGGRANTRVGGHPGLDVVVRSKRGQANLKRVALTLPSGLSINLTGLAACTEAQLAQNACPAASRAGTATATTPILHGALTGPVYLVLPSGGGLPRLVVKLAGSGLNIELDGATRFSGGRITNTFPAIPDVPISKFTISLKSGRGALLTPGQALCSRARRSSLSMNAQNGRRLTKSVALATRCPKAKKAKRTRRGAGGARSRSSGRGRA